MGDAKLEIKCYGAWRRRKAFTSPEQSKKGWRMRCAGTVLNGSASASSTNKG